MLCVDRQPTILSYLNTLFTPYTVHARRYIYMRNSAATRTCLQTDSTGNPSARLSSDSVRFVFGAASLQRPTDLYRGPHAEFLSDERLFYTIMRRCQSRKHFHLIDNHNIITGRVRSRVYET